MNRQWKPGDVAVRRNGVSVQEQRSLVVQTCANSHAHGLGLHWHHANGGWDPLEPRGIMTMPTYRPLVVIDPESHEEVGRLADAFCHARWDHTPGSSECDPLTRSSMSIALREFADPKRAEPTGLGAAVRATAHRLGRARLFVRIGSAKAPWMDSDGNGHEWSELDVVEVLSEGVTA